MSKSADLKTRKAAAVPTGVGSRGVYVAKAENSELWDVDGRRFIDFAAGIAVLNTGHRHPRVMEAVAAQALAFTHTCFHVAPYESYVRLAERLNALAPGDFAKKTLFLNSGAEAIENAVKIARYHTKRSAVIAFSGGFHGRTLMTMALTGKVMPYKRGFGPFPAEVYHAEFPQPYRGISTEQALADLDRLFHGDVDPKSVAAIVIEPVQGEGGFNVAPADFLRALRRICDEHGIVMIADEVQGGIARTGKMFSIEHSGAVPDVITMAKGLGGGFPLSAVTGRATIMDAAHPGGLGGTYGGNPISIAAAHAVLDVVETEGLCQRAAAIGDKMRARLLALSKELPCIGDVRGLGAMVAFELIKDPKTKEPDADLTAAVLTHAEARGLILLSCGTSANVVRLLSPLTIPDAVLEEGLVILAAALRDACGRESTRAVA
ncbi:MAG TPA: 4-aminobutyrate--2-oxoglutarate transaminase [Steroidobacteraceae bacterium]|jgi:4-aminobutyrate aminotransferase/4-aminobutyrate aminotransferase/(S)-3-amino-2-methylpropionate transaminase|nr:4-aminobutyrate--2-oxoglutarate transaminase [Steroidobacteraceae bacterium]